MQISKIIFKYDSLNFNRKENKIKINKLTNIPDSFNIKYYLKIINEEDYIKNEIINTIAITESNYTILYSKTEENGKIIFNLNGSIELDTYYHINAYSIVSDNNDDFEYVSYSNIRFYQTTREIKASNIKLIIASISISGATLFILLISCIAYCCRKARRRRYSIIDFHIGNYNYNDDNDDDDLFLIED